jgi:beta-lactamase regulating signal transducer with metallopeptidase domain
MDDILIRYLFPAAISLLALYALFALTLRNETFFGWNRVFLVISIVVSFILPLIHIPLQLQSTVFDAVYISSPAPTATVIADSESIFSFSLLLTLVKQSLLYIYIAGAIFFTIRLLCGLFKILFLINRYGIVHTQGSKVVFMQNNIPHFSFFNLVFINRNFLDSEQEALVLIHEKEHLRQRHFIDLMVLELLIIVQWFNPATWLFRRSLKSVHEFQADRAVMNHGFEKTEYLSLIYKQITGFKPDVFINKFNYFTFKKRIMMMSRKESSVWAKVK